MHFMLTNRNATYVFQTLKKKIEMSLEIHVVQQWEKKLPVIILSRVILNQID